MEDACEMLYPLALIKTFCYIEYIYEKHTPGAILSWLSWGWTELTENVISTQYDSS